MEQNTGMKIRQSEPIAAVEKAVERALPSAQTDAHPLGYIGTTPDFMLDGQHYNIDNLTPELVETLIKKFPLQTKGLFAPRA